MGLIFLFTDFGREGPYVGQMQAALARGAPDTKVIELFSDLPAFDPQSAAYLLPAYSTQAQTGDVVLGVVDPGVGSARRCVAARADGVWYVGPDNGLFSQVVRRARSVEVWSLPVPPTASATFHGRDVFAPAAAQVSAGNGLPTGQSLDPSALDRPAWPDDLPAIIYLDKYGNAMTGLRVSALKNASALSVRGALLNRGRTFSDCPEGHAFFYPNANGLFEIAVNGGSAVRSLGLKIGDKIELK